MSDEKKMVKKGGVDWIFVVGSVLIFFGGLIAGYGVASESLKTFIICASIGIVVSATGIILLPVDDEKEAKEWSKEEAEDLEVSDDEEVSENKEDDENV